MWPIASFLVAWSLACGPDADRRDLPASSPTAGELHRPRLQGADSAAAAADSLARAVPEIASWLYLRLAARTADSARRSQLYARVTLPVARDRIPWVEAAAREHSGDLSGALRAYAALGAPISVLRLRYALARSTPARDSVSRDLLRLVSSSNDGETVRDAAALFDRSVAHPTPDQELVIARNAARVGAWTRARQGFARAGPVEHLAPADRFAFARALAQGRENRRAAALYLGIDAPANLARAARYQGARALLSSDPARARRLLVQAAAAADTWAAASLALLADLASDAGNDAASRSLLLQLVRRFPSSAFAPAAAFNAALASLVLEQPAVAAREFATLTRTGDASQAEYWEGKALERAGDRNGARAAWRRVLQRDSMSYYAVLSARRLGTSALHSAAGTAGYPRLAVVDSAMVRIGLLRRYDMSPEVGFESTALMRMALAEPATLLAVAAAFRESGDAGRSIALGRRALAELGSSPRVLRLVYPVTARETLIARARSARIDPVLVAALIRQESGFNPRALSPAGAMGLMQVMPSVGRSIARGLGIVPWSAALLYDPSVNITIGIRHLAPLIRSQPDVAHALAAYNAGESRVRRWSLKAGARDPDLFTERIPFAETREYVKVVQRNRELYQVLYAW